MKVKWQDNVSIRKQLERANMERLSEDVGKRREPGNDCITALTRVTEGKREKGWPNTTWRGTVERDRSRPWWQS